MKRLMQSTYPGLIPMLGLFLLAGCSSPMLTMRGDPDFAPSSPVVPALTAPANGSIYSAATAMTLFQDTTARRVGDLLTIVLVE
jgi:flagellar L-ring protein precursor FlgH